MSFSFSIKIEGGEEREVANCLTAREDRGVSNQKQTGTAIAIKVKEATKQGYANALVGGDRQHKSVPSEQQDEKGESG